MMPTPTDLSRERGSALIPVLIMLLSIAGMCAAMNMTTIATQRSARISHDLARAAHAADSAISFYELQLEIDGDYFIDNPAPHDARPSTQNAKVPGLLGDLVNPMNSSSSTRQIVLVRRVIWSMEKRSSLP